jgi:adenylate cyclase class IV
MPRNIEIKARVVSVEALLAQARALADGEPETIDQDDTFFAVAMGRLKLREIADGSAAASATGTCT